MVKSYLASVFFLLGSFAFAQQAEIPLIKIDTLADGFTYDIRYATDNNFLKEAFYDCASCYLRPEVAAALKEANHYFCEKGYRIVLY
ncbi:MAG: peptidase M15, partial [Bacteroidota bacterium]|nr:peptidase M15 [Bacteroidota bacterium]